MLFELIDRQLTKDRINKLTQQVKEFEERTQKFEKDVSAFDEGYTSGLHSACTSCHIGVDKCIEHCYQDECVYYQAKDTSVEDVAEVTSPTLVACECKNCGGRLNQKTLVCEFCGTPYRSVTHRNKFEPGISFEF